MSEGSLYCATCQRPTLHRSAPVNHVLHALLTLFLCGLWAPVWLFVTLSAQRERWMCTTCGTRRPFG